MRNQSSDLRILHSDALPLTSQRLYGEQGPLQSSYKEKIFHLSYSTYKITLRYER